MHTSKAKLQTTLNYYELQVLIAHRKLSSISIVVGEACVRTGRCVVSRRPRSQDENSMTKRRQTSRIAVIVLRKLLKMIVGDFIDFSSI